MKNIALYLIIAFTAIAITVNGQRSSKNRYMFDEFTDGKVLMKNGSVVHTSLNYDWINQEINYFDGEEQMILTGLETIDTIYIAAHKFIPYGKFLLEVIPINTTDNLYINWKIKITNKGRQGAMGTTSHAVTSQTYDINSIQGRAMERSDQYIYDATSENSYYVRIDDRFKMFNSEKSFLKLFPKEEAEKIQSYIKTQKLDMKKVPDIISVVNYSLALD